jgi:hypothetical protein
MTQQTIFNREQIRKDQQKQRSGKTSRQLKREAAKAHKTRIDQSK